MAVDDIFKIYAKHILNVKTRNRDISNDGSLFSNIAAFMFATGPAFHKEWEHED
jgi:hypothetical protein